MNALQAATEAAESTYAAWVSAKARVTSAQNALEELRRAESTDDAAWDAAESELAVAQAAWLAAEIEWKATEGPLRDAAYAHGVGE